MPFAGLIGFASPWLLLGLLALPLIWWLLRTTPPRPNRVAFPAVRILRDLINRERTPSRTPWWLMLIRMLAAAAIILALAEPSLNPRGRAIEGTGPLAIVVDNGWGAAADWPARKAALDLLLDEAERDNRPTLIVETAPDGRASVPVFAPASRTAERAAALAPAPHAPERAGAARRLRAALDGADGVTISWIADPLDYGAAQAFQEDLLALVSTPDRLTVVEPKGGSRLLALRRASGVRGLLKLEVLALPGDRREGTISAFTAQGQRLADTTFAVEAGASLASASLDLPLELANQVSRLEISSLEGASSPGPAAVHLLDARSRWKRVALISGESQEGAQPLLAPLYYLERALQPFADIVRGEEGDLSGTFESVLERRVSTLVLANIGTLVGRTEERVREWVRTGGVLVRFAGPRLERAGDPLLPVPLRFGGRTLGGALSWSTPQRLQTFDETSIFAGLPVPEEVTVNRQVLADPAGLTPDVSVWARLTDGTPLVTARREGEGWLVLVHVTANSDWSNLPLSGLFVDMMRQLLTVSNLSLAAGEGKPVQTRDDGDAATEAAVQASTATVLAPQITLDGLGRLGPPPVTAQPISLNGFEAAEPSAIHPPGFYGLSDASRALNVMSVRSELVARPPTPSGVATIGIGDDETVELRPWLFLAGLALLLVDALALMLLQGGRRALSTTTRSAAILLLVASGMLTIGASTGARAQNDGTGSPAATATTTPDEQAATAFALSVSLATRFAYVVTGDEEVDRTSERGLSGLAHVLRMRTAVEPGEPIGIDISSDELAFFPIVYWPVLPDAEALDDATLSRIDTYMKQGGMLVFDTRDYGQSFGEGASDGPGARALQRLISRLDIPRLEQVPPDHVMSKSFYLLSSFPGRWDGGPLWVEAGGQLASDSREVRQVDGVSSILITANDLAAAWATDDVGRPLYAVVPGGELQREMAYRVGVNIVMYALTGNYKADQVHIPALLERLGQ
ncbi:MAG: DUF4159 domain-containing protein [Rhizobiales bacterium]|nr:DUF4159 domain-containing protein [Hyphomicrobiales bacterium]